MDMVKKAAQLHTLISWKLQELSDGEAVQMPDLYPLWEAGTEYPAQALVYHGTACSGWSRPTPPRPISRPTARDCWLSTGRFGRRRGYTAGCTARRWK